MSARPSESEPMSLSPPNSSVVAGVDAKRVCSPPPVFVFVVTARFFFSASSGTPSSPSAPSPSPPPPSPSAAASSAFASSSASRGVSSGVLFVSAFLGHGGRSSASAATASRSSEFNLMNAPMSSAANRRVSRHRNASSFLRLYGSSMSASGSASSWTILRNGDAEGIRSSFVRKDEFRFPEDSSFRSSSLRTSRRFHRRSSSGLPSDTTSSGSFAKGSRFFAARRARPSARRSTRRLSGSGGGIASSPPGSGARSNARQFSRFHRVQCLSRRSAKETASANFAPAGGVIESCEKTRTRSRSASARVLRSAARASDGVRPSVPFVSGDASSERLTSLVSVSTLETTPDEAGAGAMSSRWLRNTAHCVRKCRRNAASRSCRRRSGAAVRYVTPADSEESAETDRVVKEPRLRTFFVTRVSPFSSSASMESNSGAPSIATPRLRGSSDAPPAANAAAAAAASASAAAERSSWCVSNAASTASSDLRNAFQPPGPAASVLWGSRKKICRFQNVR
mmetsp:Transcript_13715/g.58605  ORF Transcript_13715/g.58605 Transcript_13715/m.58605 type:complete len:511 (-) Transcript_13715:864-2396(-)